ncbi:MAG: putative transporter [Bacteroidales bacterium]|nr:putative transporter [Bacteroidales bacterium]
MQWLYDIFFTPSVGQSILLLALTIAAGLYLGQFKIKGVSLGVTWVLFVGLILSHFGMVPDSSMMTFIKDFGLILFVYAIGLQVGPSFFSSLKEGGLKLNIVAIVMIVMACVTAAILAFATNTPLDVMTGIMTGAVTNTPSLGAAQQTLKDAGSANGPMLSSAYAVAYPLAVLSIIFVPIIMRAILRIDSNKEEQEAKSSNTTERERIALKVTLIDNLTVEQLTKLFTGKFIISRIMRQDGQEEHVNSTTIIRKGDILRIIIGKDATPEFVKIIGEQLNDKEIPWEDKAGNLVSKRIVVTRPEIQGRTIGELQLGKRYNVTITGVKRASVDLLASASLQLQMGDRVLVVGEDENVQQCAQKLGNSLKRLDIPNLIPIFIGIVLGILVGIIPIKFPGIPQPVKLGLAGGPLIVSILIARFGPMYKVVTYATTSALMMLREMGICLFLGAVGLTSGAGFVQTIVDGGYMWIIYGLIITIVPIVIGFLLARLVYKMPYYTIVGLISGSYTDPPALAFANASTETDRPAVAYATVYPLTMFLRIFAGEIMILIALSI